MRLSAPPRVDSPAYVCLFSFFFSSRRRHTRSVSAFLLNRSSDLQSLTAYDVYPLDGRHDGGYYTVKDCVTIDVLPRTPRSEERRVGKEGRARWSADD